ncbi:uncharacterized protein BO95DRAFT_426805 [Aspergillus brunneoviolaceus CBS 621.78]|uniref:Uncharacterized protein n=1 Tax=Aspergillus brunneoviolaceus CBS 621.78 TaxID=1450534 RepID=A0ACD1GR83_9EURO|nr:hypothetical protein BO95DRAFT_426805 [Aspergillus brunneoviolaceus CBS 621.78]RAH51586.1 hypothetical protein BO95DRAFT_426805 [Aspergillus brunneoviolaceus CBS 621.78]
MDLGPGKRWLIRSFVGVMTTKSNGMTCGTFLPTFVTSTQKPLSGDAFQCDLGSRVSQHSRHEVYDASHNLPSTVHILSVCQSLARNRDLSKTTSSRNLDSICDLTRGLILPIRDSFELTLPHSTMPVAASVLSGRQSTDSFRSSVAGRNSTIFRLLSSLRFKVGSTWRVVQYRREEQSLYARNAAVVSHIDTDRRWLEHRPRMRQTVKISGGGFSSTANICDTLVNDLTASLSFLYVPISPAECLSQICLIGRYTGFNEPSYGVNFCLGRKQMN